MRRSLNWVSVIDVFLTEVYHSEDPRNILYWCDWVLQRQMDFVRNRLSKAIGYQWKL